jgi:hypothetical protein
VAKVAKQENRELSVMSNMGPSAASPMVCRLFQRGLPKEFLSFPGLPNSSVIYSAIHTATKMGASPTSSYGRVGEEQSDIRGLLSREGLMLRLLKIPK